MYPIGSLVQFDLAERERDVKIDSRLRSNLIEILQ